MTEISLQQREQLARIAMRTELENQQAGESVELFIRHHLEEIEPEYWQEHFATATPYGLTGFGCFDTDFAMGR